MNKLNLPGLPGLPMPAASSQKPALGLPGLGAPLANTRPAIPVYSRYDRQTEERYARLLQGYQIAQRKDPHHNLKATRVALKDLVMAHFMSGNMRGDVLLAAQTWREAIIASEDPHLALDEIRLGANMNIKVQTDAVAAAYSHLFMDFENKGSFDPRYAVAFAEFTRTTNPAMYSKYARHLPHNSKDPIIIAELAAGERAKNPGHALERIYRALAVTPDHPKLLIRLSQMTGNNDDFDENLQRAEQLVTMRPEWPDVHVAHARALENLGKLPQALTAYEIARVLQPSDFITHCIRQNLNLQAEVKNEIECHKLDKIEKWRNSPRYKESHRQRQAEILAEHEQTEALLARQSQANEFERRQLRHDALKAYEMKHPATAAQHFHRYLALTPSDSLLRSRYAESLFAMGKKAEAERQVRRAFADAHEDHLAEPQHYNLEILQSLGKILLSDAPATLGEIEQYCAPAAAMMPEHKGLSALNEKIKQAWSQAEQLAEEKEKTSPSFIPAQLTADDDAEGETELYQTDRELVALRASYEKAADLVARDIAEPSRITPDVSRHHATFCELSVRLHGEDDELRDQLLDVTPRRGFLNAVIERAFDELPVIPGTGVDLILSRGTPIRPASPNIPNIIKDHNHD